MGYFAEKKAVVEGLLHLKDCMKIIPSEASKEYLKFCLGNGRMQNSHSVPPSCGER